MDRRKVCWQPDAEVRQQDGWKEGWMDGEKDGWMDGWDGGSLLWIQALF